MDNETKTFALCLLVMCGVLTAFLMIALERDDRHVELQTQSWKDQGYPIGKVIEQNKKIEAIKNEIKY